jgi:hypothetical protein
MDGGTPLLMTFFSVIDALANGVVALIPFAIWQRTRVAGFAVVGASFAATAVMVLMSGWVFGVAGTSTAVLVVWRLFALAITVLAAVGFWMIYRALRAQTVAASPAAPEA